MALLASGGFGIWEPYISKQPAIKVGLRGMCGDNMRGPGEICLLAFSTCNQTLSVLD